MRPLLSLLLCPLLAGLPEPVAADPVFVPTSSIVVTFRAMGLPIEAPFSSFTATVDFDPARPDTSSAQFTIDVASIDLGDPEYNKEVLRPEWFDSVSYPTASFVSSRLKAISQNQIGVCGKLTLKGQTQNECFVVTIQSAGTQRAYDGVVHVSRTTFGIGTGEWLGFAIVADDVTIAVHAVTRIEAAAPSAAEVPVSPP
jgi:polyisoprenoid-binding protein YceI